MAEVYIRTDSTTGVVTFVHRRPFDPVHGLGETRDALLKTGFFVDEFPEPNATVGKRAVAYYDHERKKVYYEYETVPFSEKEQLNMIQDMLNDVLITSNSIPRMVYGINYASVDSAEEKESDNMSNGLAKYLAYQIYQGKLDKEKVLNSYSDIADDIKKYLSEWDTIPVIDPEED